MSESEIPAVSGAVLGVLALFYFAVIAFFIVCAWKVYAKAGQPGWAAIVPIYNIIVMLQIVGRPLWWIVLLFIPLVNLVVAILLALDLAKAFGKSEGFAVGLLLLGFIFYPILAFGSATYQGPPHKATA
jgi:Family of unknown function (DUF5684)